MTDFATALAYAQRGELASAERVLRNLLQLAPNQPDALHLLANVRHSQGDFAGAADLFARAAAAAPNDAAIAFNRAAVLAALSRHSEAVDAFTHALKLKRGDPEAHLGRAVALSGLSRYAEALADYDAALAAGLDRSDLHANRGATLGALERHEEAVAACDRALASNPRSTKAHLNRGASLMALDRPAEALDALDKAIALTPLHPMARANRATARANFGDFDRALDDIDTAIAAQPNRPDHQARRGFILAAASRVEEAIAAYDLVLAQTPDDADIIYAKADALLASGDFARGLPLYEERAKAHKLPPPPADAPPLWRGESLAGKTILVQGEQGFGDLFQFSRFIPPLAAQGARVILRERPQTHALMRSLEGVTELASSKDAPPAADYRIPLASLMLATNMRLETIPAPIPYLRAEPSRVAHWRERLGARAKPRVGIAWSGGDRYVLQRRRKLTLAALDDLLNGANAEFISLHMDDGEAAPVFAKHNVRSFGKDTADFADLAALIETLDLVISIDTGAAHLAGALGKPTWTLLPSYADWRWLRDRADTPWYPHMRLYRQPRFGDWGSVVQRVRADLTALQ